MHEALDGEGPRASKAPKNPKPDPLSSKSAAARIKMATLVGDELARLSRRGCRITRDQIKAEASELLALLGKADLNDICDDLAACYQRAFCRLRHHVGNA